MQWVGDKQMNDWVVWQCGVVAELRFQLPEHLGEIDDRDVDWDAWFPLFLEGCSPRDAVDKALVRH